MGAADKAGEAQLRIGVSSCLLGNEVRFDSGHKRDRFVTDVLSNFVEFVPVCPEVEVGMGIPRPALRLIHHGDAAEVRLVEIKSGRDHTLAMERYAARRVAELRKLGLVGYVLKRSSPSCGMERVKVYGKAGMPTKAGVGLYARALLAAYPELPVEEEGRLNDPVLRENFIERVFAYHRLGELFSGRWTPGQVVAFHTAHKLQLMAHSPAAYRELGRLVADVKQLDRDEFKRAYRSGFMAALARRATRGRNTNVLQHAAGYLKKQLDKASRAELASVIEDYRLGLIPIIVPLVLIRHHVRRCDIEYLQGQLFLEPHPKELMLRNHV
jgi:uncharacterized protein YbgA (DUF1722 family)/uncharacterized protein YbbK (DUF523 family)